MGVILTARNASALALGNKRDNVLIFLHIPKTGGVTLERILVRQYPLSLIHPFIKPEEYKQVTALSPSVLNRYRAFQGHFPFGLHEYLASPSIYVTQLREPMDTALSSYFYFELDYRKQVQGREIEWTMPTVDELLSSQMRLMFDNLQTRFLSNSLGARFGRMTREMLDTAKRNLETMAVVGLTERYDESILLMSDMLGWRAPYYIKANVTRLRPRDQAIPADVREFLQEHNQLDNELYALGKAIFAEQLEKQGKDLPERLRKYRERNKRYGSLFDRLARAKSKAQKLPIVGELV
jgi:hypothetical protein